MQKLMTILLIAALALTLPSLCAHAATIRVPADQPTIQAGIDAANDGDTVLVADGTFRGEGNRDIELRGKAISLRSENGPESCIIDAEGSESVPHGVFIFHDGETRHTIIEGLTITGGYACGIELDLSDDPQRDSSSPIIRHCIITGNETGILNHSGYPLIESNRVTGNSGHGIYSAGGARIVNSKITGNGGGGICLRYSDWSATIENCLIAGNTGGELGGGIYCVDSRQTIRNCTIVNNSGPDGGGLTLSSMSGISLRNCILAGNSGGLGDQYAVLQGSSYYGSYLGIYYCCVFGDTYVEPGCSADETAGVIHENPLFVTGPDGAYYLSQTTAGQVMDSPCVDSGNPESEMIQGTTRTDRALDSGIVDMGFHYPDPGAAHHPDTIILTGPPNGGDADSSVVVFIFTGEDPSYPPSALSYSWRFSGEDWSDWSPRTWAAHSVNSYQPARFEVRARNPEGLIDPVFADRLYNGGNTYFQVPNVAIGPGPGPGNPPVVQTNSSYEWAAYSAMQYGVNLAAGDVNGNGFDEVITGPGPGEMFGPHVRCFSGDGTVIHNAGFLAYGTHKYGVEVAAGDVDGDGFDEIVTGAGPGAVFGPHVRGWNWDGGPSSTPMSGISFFAYGTLKWGVNVTCGDIDGDGDDEIITGAGPGAVFGPHVRGWDYEDGVITPKQNLSYFAYGTPRWGVNVACGDLDGDGMDEIITGPGPGPQFQSHVRAWVYDGSQVTQMPGASFFAYNGLGFGAVVSASDVDDDARDEILTMPGPGPSNPLRLRAWDVDDGQVSLAMTSIYDIDFLVLGEWMTHGGVVTGARTGWW